MKEESRTQQRVRAAAERHARQTRHRRRRQLIAAGAAIAVVLVAVAALVVVGLTRKGPAAVARTLAPAAAARAVTTVPAQSFARTGTGGTQPSLLALDGKAVTAGGKPLVLYVGAEYCPFCAAQRWPVVVALSRFGTWSGLGATASAAADIHPDTATFSFAGAHFTSAYLTFQGVETRTNQRSGTSYTRLDTLTPEQQRLLDTYDAPPYVPASAAGSIPFIDYAGRYASSGSGYDPGLLKGMTLLQIADAVQAGSSPAAQAILGTANRITAAVCALTGGQPGSVCGTPQIRTLVSQLPHVP